MTAALRAEMPLHAVIPVKNAVMDPGDPACTAVIKRIILPLWSSRKLSASADHKNRILYSFNGNNISVMYGMHDWCETVLSVR